MGKEELQKEFERLGEEMQVIPYVAYEKQQARNEREKKGLHRIIILLICLFSLYAFLNTFYFEVESTTTTSSQEVEGGSASIVSGKQYNDNATNNE